MKPARILYFVDGPSPKPEDFKAANELNANVSFRNARAVPAEGSLEECDGVAGKVPPRYAAKFPTAEEAIKARAAKLAALAQKTGDTPPHLPPGGDQTAQNGAGSPPAAPAAGDGAPAPGADAGKAGSPPAWGGMPGGSKK